MYIVGRYALLFLVYSFLGAVGETLFRLITEHHLYGIHGFLHLPILPIYGVGALLIVTLIGKHTKHPLLLFFSATIVTTILEFITHWLIEMIFHTSIWNYDNNLVNIDGRVSLESSIVFGLAALLLVYMIHPFMLRVLKHIPKRTMTIWGWVIGVVLLLDIVTSVIQRLS